MRVQVSSIFAGSLITFSHGKRREVGWGRLLMNNNLVLTIGMCPLVFGPFVA
jgi:hypothetical protein